MRFKIQMPKETSNSSVFLKILDNMYLEENMKVIIRSEEDYDLLMNFLFAIGVYFFNGKLTNIIDFNSSVENYGLPFCVNLLSNKITNDYCFVRQSLSTYTLEELSSIPNDSYKVINMKDK